MTSERDLQLFLYNSAVLQKEISAAQSDTRGNNADSMNSASSELAPYISQFSEQTRRAAFEMSGWYVLFHMLENEIRRFIAETLDEKSPGDWWEKCVPHPVQQEVSQNRAREQDFALVPRSDEDLDYTTFGQLGDIIRANWDVFGGVLSSQKAVGRVMATLNALRGPIAHCGSLAPDEIDRLKLSIKDWFRVMGGPQ